MARYEEEFVDEEFEDEFDDFEDEFDEYGDEFDGFEDDAFLPPDKVYVQGEVSKGFEFWALLVAILMVGAAGYLLYQEVLVSVYDGMGTIDETVERSLTGADWVDQDGTIVDVAFAPPTVPVLAFTRDRLFEGENDPNPSTVDFATIGMGSDHGVTPGLIYYLRDPNRDYPADSLFGSNGTPLSGVKQEDVAMRVLVIMDRVAPRHARAMICSFTEDTLQPDKEITILRTSYIDPARAISAEATLRMLNQSDLLTAMGSTPFPPSPPMPQSLLESLVEEALTAPSLAGARDPNPDWNILQRHPLSLEEAGTLGSNRLSLSQKEDRREWLVSFQQYPLAVRAPATDQRVFRDIFEELITYRESLDN